jgi:hypothetical protein
MTRRNIVIWSIVTAVVLGFMVVSVTIFIAQIQQDTNAAVAIEKAHFEATQTADAR